MWRTIRVVLGVPLAVLLTCLDVKWMLGACRDGLTTRPISGSDEIQLRIDPMQADLDEEISGFYSQVRRLRNVAEEIGTEAKFQNDFLNQLQLTMIKAQAGVKNNVRKLNKSIIKNGSNSVVHVVVFALVLFFLVYLWSKVSRK